MATPITPLLIRYGRLGDMLLQEPLLHLLSQRYATPCRIISAGTWTGALYAAHPDVGEITQFRSRRTLLAFSPERWRAIAWLRHFAGPIYISEDSRGSLKHIRWLLHWARVPRERCVFVREIGEQADEHKVEQMLRFGRATPAAFRESDYPWRDDDAHAAPRLYLDANDRADAESWLRQRGLMEAPLILLQPGNWRLRRWWQRRGVDPKFWPVESWATLLRAMHKALPTANLLLCGSPVETPVCEAIARETNLLQVKLATTDLPVRRLLGVLERAHSMVSVDSGPAHLAAAMGCPLVVLYGGKYGPQNWARRSAFGQPIVNLGAQPPEAGVAQIAPAQAFEAWRGLSTARPALPDADRAGMG
ncbi:MAG: glycosyltransferase family 9 protein [Rudaea sp.]